MTCNLQFHRMPMTKITYNLYSTSEEGRHKIGSFISLNLQDINVSRNNSTVLRTFDIKIISFWFLQKKKKITF